MYFYDFIDSSWEIRYSQFVGDLVLFNSKIGSVNQMDMEGEKVYGVKMVFDKRNHELLMVKINNATDILNAKLDDLSKNDIIRIIKEYLNDKSKTAAQYKQHTACRMV